ncbi:MAG TPA: DUF485 domain-containing protein [Capillimicrobium sp.]|nr:DUF485 domain-containing protein [Capillimicrobium sp.]
MAVRTTGERIDWQAVERAPEFQELVRRRRRWVVPATIFFLAWYLGFIVLAGYAPDFMGESIYEGFTVGYLLALTQFVMVWVLATWYVRKSDREFDPLRDAAAARAHADVEAQRRDQAARFERDPQREVRP